MSKSQKKQHIDKKIVNIYDAKYNKSMQLRYDFGGALRHTVSILNGFLKHPKFKQYFFYKSIHPVLCLYDLTNPKKYRRNVLTVELTDSEKDTLLEQLQNIWVNETELYKIYDTVRKKCVSCRNYYFNNYKLLKKTSRHPLGIAKSSLLEETMMNCLNLLSNEFCLFYFYSHKFHFCRNNVNFLLEFDFYCIMFHENRLIQFVVEVDGTQHQTGGFSRKNKDSELNSPHVCDIMKQYYLSQMNIHLLRINNVSNAEEQTRQFIENIVTSTKYVIMNGTEIQDKYFTSEINHDGLQMFHKHFISCHENIIKELKNYDAESYYAPQKILDDYHPENIEYVVSASELQKFLNSDICFHR